MADIDDWEQWEEVDLNKVKLEGNAAEELL